MIYGVQCTTIRIACPGCEEKFSHVLDDNQTNHHITMPYEALYVFMRITAHTDANVTINNSPVALNAKHENTQKYTFLYHINLNVYVDGKDYNITLQREEEPACGWVVELKSKYQSISVFKVGYMLHYSYFIIFIYCDSIGYITSR